VSDEEFPLNEDDDGSFVLPTPSSSSSSSYMSEGDQDDFDVSSDEDDEMQSEPSVAGIDAATFIGSLYFFYALNPEHHTECRHAHCYQPGTAHKKECCQRAATATA